MTAISIGITMGDPSGIGPEIISKALARPGINRLGKISVIGDKWVFDKFATSFQPNTYNFIDLNNVPRRSFGFGKVKKESGQAALEYLEKAVELIKKREIDCLVTAPISKLAINLAGYKYSGHTEFLAHAFGKKSEDLVMMLLNKNMKVTLVTRHLAIKKISPALNQKTIYKTIIETFRALREYFGISQPKICVVALNPHAGEGGLLGREEIEKISPAVREARKALKDLIGPLPADTAFLEAKQGKIDCVVAMYHDQALIPLKILDPASGVNLTLGLGFVRTSPLHGTAFDIAGKNVASEASFVSAITTAAECTKNARSSKPYAIQAEEAMGAEFFG